MSKRSRTIYYILTDFLSAVLAWTIFNYYRKTHVDSLKFLANGELPGPIFDNQFYLSVFILPVIWVLVYYLSGSYNNVLRKSRINEFVQTIATSIIGVTVLFFVLLLDDSVVSYRLYYKLYFVLFISHFFITASTRLILSTATNRKIHRRQFGFNTIIIGSNERALKMFTEIKSLKYGIGNNFIGFIHIEGKNGYSEQLKQELPHLGEYHSIKTIIETHHIEEVIIALESWEHEYIKNIVNDLGDLGVITIF
jgi:FlaA1/EpsC-like NDP-sugar epimerase